MRKFFYGWRRKAGLVILVVALLLLGRWMRGQRTADLIGLYNIDNREILFLRSSREGLMWEHHVAFTDKMTPVPRWRRIPLKANGPVMPFEDPNWLLSNALDRRWHLCGFDFGKWHATKPIAFTVTYGNIPYWSLILPLTLLSASLVFSRARPPRKPVVPQELPTAIGASLWTS